MVFLRVESEEVVHAAAEEEALKTKSQSAAMVSVVPVADDAPMKEADTLESSNLNHDPGKSP